MNQTDAGLRLKRRHGGDHTPHDNDTTQHNMRSLQTARKCNQQETPGKPVLRNCSCAQEERRGAQAEGIVPGACHILNLSFPMLPVEFLKLYCQIQIEINTADIVIPQLHSVCGMCNANYRLKVSVATFNF